MKFSRFQFLPGLLLVMAVGAGQARGETFDRRWSYVSETSAAVYWQLGDISQSAVSQVQYGTTQALGQSTEMTRRARWSHLHHLSGLTAGATYYYRMVAVDTLTHARSESAILSFTTQVRPEAIRVPGNLSGPPYILDQPGAYYILTQDITSDGDAFRLNADNVILDLDGHTVTFGNNTGSQVFGVRFTFQGKGSLCNGRIVQGARSGLYSCAIRSNSRPNPTEIFGISTDVHLKCAYPLNFFNNAAHVQVHHNHFYSRVTDIESRHYPGNAILQMEVNGGDIQIYDNLLTEGCHRGLLLGGSGTTGVEVHHNDIQHHMQYTNGYALIPCDNSDFHHNKVTSTGRGVHLNTAGIQFHENYIATVTHQERDDLPANTSGSDPDLHNFDMNLIEAHGIKFEGGSVKNCKVYNNYVRMVQRLPKDSGGRGAPEDKLDNGVYVNGMSTSSSATSLTDNTMSWQKNRWRNYYLRYSDAFPSSFIGENSSNTLTSNLQGGAGADYTIYQKWQYVPPTPLNIACYAVDANNEVYGNTFIGLTEYEDGSIRHGGYGDTGNWATAIMFIAMDKGFSPSGQYSIYVHNNTFISNDLYLNSDGNVNMTVRIEHNTFRLEGAPHVINRSSRLRAIGSDLENAVYAGSNQFAQGAATRSMDVNGDGTIGLLDVLSFVLMRRKSPSNPLNDWNVDGRMDSRDFLALLRNVISEKYGPTALAAAPPAVRDSVVIMTAKQHAELEASGRDGL